MENAACPDESVAAPALVFFRKARVPDSTKQICNEVTLHEGGYLADRAWPHRRSPTKT